MSKAREKLLKNSTIPETAILTKSKVYGKKSSYKTQVPMINVALSADINGGLQAGIGVIAGKSKHFKSSFMLLLASTFLEQEPDGVILFYDSEFGTPASYVQNFNIDPENIVHSPITNIEKLKFDIVAQLDGLERGDKVMIIIDSIGNLASKKEIEDAKKEHAAADMTRAKELKSLGRMITPELAMKDIPLVCVGHTYETLELYSKSVLSGGTGIYYSADWIWFIGRQQDKDAKTKEITGWDFIINIEKSRYGKEKMKIPISISYDAGINQWSGLLEMALEGQYIAKPSNGWYQLVDRETGELIGTKMREDDVANNDELWHNLFATTDFANFINSQFSFTGGILNAKPEEKSVYDIDDELEDS